MTVSVLCPTRLRPERLQFSLASLDLHATGDYEVLLAVDPDDPTDYESFDVDQVLRTDQRYGYPELHRYLNWLAVAARGDWLMLWNDDCVMQTDGWDRIIDEQSPAVLAPHTHHDPLVILPIIPKAWTEACGHYAELLHVDSWWLQIGLALDAVRWIDVEVDHQRFDKPGHETAPDEVYQERAFRLHELGQLPLRETLARDIQIVRGLIA